MYFTEEDQQKALEYFLSFDEIIQQQNPADVFKVLPENRSNYIRSPEFYKLVDLRNDSFVTYANKKLALKALNEKIKKFDNAGAGMKVYNKLSKTYRLKE